MKNLGSFLYCQVVPERGIVGRGDSREGYKKINRRKVAFKGRGRPRERTKQDKNGEKRKKKKMYSIGPSGKKNETTRICREGKKNPYVCTCWKRKKRP
jgi:hypothetical protein